MRLLRDFSRHWGEATAQKFARFRRTFERRDRHTCVGGFQRPMPNGRRQAMIFRLRGVALFGGSVRRVPAERKRQERPDQLIVVGSLPRLLLRRLRERRRRRRSQRQAQACTLQIHRGRPSPSMFLKIRVGLKSLRSQNGALILKSCIHSRKIGAGFQPVLLLRPEK